MTVRPYPSVHRAVHQLERHIQAEPEPQPAVGSADWAAVSRALTISPEAYGRWLAHASAALAHAFRPKRATP